METTQKQGKAWYLYILSVIPFIAGVAVCVLLGMKLWHGLVRFDNSLLRIVVPGEKVILFERPGDYTILHERKTVIDGAIYSSSEHSISGMKCALKNDFTGEGVLLKPSSANLTYSFGSREGSSLFDFSIKESGPFRLNCFYPEAQGGGSKTVLVVGQGFGTMIFDMISFIFGIIAIFFVACGATAVTIYYLLIRKPKSSAP